jgi:hypothetical protein
MLPWAVENVPMMQSKHEDIPVALANVWTGHAAHEELPFSEEYCPALQRVHILEDVSE